MFNHRSTFYFIIYEIFLFVICLTELFWAIQIHADRNEMWMEELKEEQIIRKEEVRLKEEKQEIKQIEKIDYLKKPEITSAEYEDADVIWYEEN